MMCPLPCFKRDRQMNGQMLPSKIIPCFTKNKSRNPLHILAVQSNSLFSFICRLENMHNEQIRIFTISNNQVETFSRLQFFFYYNELILMYQALFTPSVCTCISSLTRKKPGGLQCTACDMPTLQ